MLFLGTNFVVAFDPSSLFMEDGAVNVNGVKDEALAEAALDMRRTESGDLLTYSRKWIEFQARFAEAEPMIPVYPVFRNEAFLIFEYLQINDLLNVR